MQKLVFFDLETGGLDPKRHPIIQVAAIAVDAGSLREVETFEQKVSFALEAADHEALSMNSYDEVAWQDAARPSLAASRFSEFLGRHATIERMSKRQTPYYVAQLVGHNAAAFDGPFLKEWFSSLGLFLPASWHVLDTMQRVQWLGVERPDLPPPPALNLPVLRKHYGLS